MRGKRELLAQSLYWSGAAFFLRNLPARDMLLVLNYHRVGNSEEDLFDPGVFSATGEELDAQVSYLKRYGSLVGLQEAQEFVEGARDSTPRCRVLLTFDDGYLDNYQIAFPILRSHGAQAVFFLPTSMVGSGAVPWWDHIAYLVRTARVRRFALRYPAALEVDLDGNGLRASLRQILLLFKRPDNTDTARFLGELAEAAKGSDLPGTLRRFLSWDEAREMIGGGMAIGSHTHSHHLLSQLGAEEQREELVRSRAELRERLGIDAEALAYPVGAPTSFSDTTQSLARDAGYRVAFSFHGGTNMRGATRAYDVKRVGVDDQSWTRFRVQAAVCRCTGRYWP